MTTSSSTPHLRVPHSQQGFAVRHSYRYLHPYSQFEASQEVLLKSLNQHYQRAPG